MRGFNLKVRELGMFGTPSPTYSGERSGELGEVLVLSNVARSSPQPSPPEYREEGLERRKCAVARFVRQTRTITYEKSERISQLAPLPTQFCARALRQTRTRSAGIERRPRKTRRGACNAASGFHGSKTRE